MKQRSDDSFEQGLSKSPPRAYTPLPPQIQQMVDGSQLSEGLETWRTANQEFVSQIVDDDYKGIKPNAAELAQHPIIRRALAEQEQNANANKEHGPHITEETDWVMVHARMKSAKDLIYAVANGRPKVSGLQLLADERVQSAIVEGQKNYESHKDNKWYKATNPTEIVRMLILIQEPMDVQELTSLCQEYLADRAPKKLHLNM